MDRATRHPLKIGRHFLVCPADRCDPVEERIPLYLGRARAFGSGLHETTVSCLEELETLAPLSDSTVLDVGCGTGILSVATLLLSARSAAAFDIDPEAAHACAANARLNGMQDRVGVYCGTMEALREDARFDLILANIYGDIILNLAQDMAARLSVGGTMILSGIDFTYVTDIKRSLGQSGLELVKNRRLEEYVTMVFKKVSGV